MMDKAEAEYLMEIKVTPYYDKARINLANLYFRQGKRARAAELLKEALLINPENEYVRKLLADYE